MSGTRMLSRVGTPRPPRSPNVTSTTHNIIRFAKNKSRQVFLLKCRRQKITPRFISDKIQHLLTHYTSNQFFAQNDVSAVNNFLQNKLLSMEIGACCRQICERQHQWSIPPDDVTYTRALHQQNAKLNAKFQHLLATQHHLAHVSYDETFVKNFTNTEIPRDVLTIFGLGPKFALAPTVLPVLDLLTDIESITNTHARHDEHLMRVTRGHMLYELTKQSQLPIRMNRIDKFLQKAKLNAERFLRDNPDIMVSTSDKGSVTIFSSKADYRQKMSSLISDTNSFKPIESDPTVTLERKIYRKLLSLKNSGLITQSERSKMNPTGTHTPRIYGQLKYHKPGLPIRPIVSTINSPAYKLSRHLATILKNSFVNPPYNIKNSAEFIRKARRAKISPGNVLVSFDVVNCFGTIPVDLALQIIDRDFERRIQPHTTLPKEEFMALLRICLKEANYFVYNDLFYRQLIGMFMGSSLASILVECVIEEIVRLTLSILHFIPDFWFIYVDDHLTSIPKHLIAHVLAILNSYHPDIQFTVEIQDDTSHSINFLDTTVFNIDGKISTNWYHKPIASNRLINFYSAHPKKMIINTATSFARRVLTLSHRRFHTENKVRIREILVKNNFPPNVISSVTNRACQGRDGRNPMRSQLSYPFLCDSTDPTAALPAADQTSPPPPPTTRYASLRYVPQTSDTLGKRISQLLPDVRIAHKPINQMRHIFTNMKQKIPTGKKSGVVYKINCADCGKCYIGETIVRLEDRIKQHINDMENMTKISTALVGHARECGHTFHFEGARALQKEATKSKLRIQEVNNIIMHRQSACNYKSDSSWVSPAYYNLVLSATEHLSQNNHNTSFDSSTARPTLSSTLISCH